ncbi:MAG: methyltransferase domain-containing protein [Oscillospiraceae bacterium]|nr:methyltransferase domain-containing protein [Oscillospiraceae bacterium]
MMEIERIRELWRDETADRSALQARVWDGAAARFGTGAEPDFENNAFLRLVAETAAPDDGMAALDVGCGCGGYSLALARRVKRAVGVDISSEMLRHAEERKAETGMQNVAFHCLDWAKADIDALNFRGAFDIVFAHMTPAVTDFATFTKLDACSRGWCFMRKPTRRRDPVLDAAFAALGLSSGGRALDDGIAYAFDYLWGTGRCPMVCYEDTVWEGERTVEEMTSWCAARVGMRKDLTQAETDRIAAAVASAATNGVIRETSTMTLVTMWWHV